MKVGREEVVGMIVAVESWVKRDRDAEWAGWVARCDHIAERASKIPGVTATVRRERGESLSNRSPSVSLRWETAKLNITGQEVVDLLYSGEPRIALGGGGGGGRRGQDLPGDTGISMTVSMMAPGDEKVVAERVYEVLSAKRGPKAAETPAPPAGNLSGRWAVDIEYTASKTTHTLHLQQDGANLAGTHQGDFVERDVTGTVNGTTVSLASVVTEQHGFALTYRFSGTIAGDTMSGSLNLGEYRSAKWSARRQPYGQRVGTA
jgi:L-seryl-tRNA(Ser) seleniumtransferase